MKNNLNYYISKFFSEYLPSVKGVSINTITSYRDTFVSLLQYLEDVKKIDISNLALNSIDNIIIEDYLQYLEDVKHNSISTRNQRLSAICSFYKYLKNRELSCFEIYSSIQSIPNKKTLNKSLSYFSKNEIEILINMPNTKEKIGFRDYVLLLFMYETACRAQELSDLTLKQLFFDDNSYVILIGKGNKERNVPISKELKKVFQKYIETFKIVDENEIVFKNKYNQKITTKGIEYILLKYINLAKLKYKDKFKNHYSNHSMRHSRAMHLLESGVNLIYIRDILGHTSVTTTEIYAKTNPVIKEKQIMEHTKQLNVKEKYSLSQKEDLLKFLKNL